MKKLLSVIVLLALTLSSLALSVCAAPSAAAELKLETGKTTLPAGTNGKFAEVEGVKGVEFSADSTALPEISDFSFNPGKNYSVDFFMKTNTNTGIQVLLAKNEKVSGHFELWLQEGVLKFYAPDIFGGGAVSTDRAVCDGTLHHIALTVADGLYRFYIDGAEAYSAQSDGAIADCTAKLTAAGLNDLSLQYSGFLSSLRFYSSALSAGDIKSLDVSADTPSDGSKYSVIYWSMDGDVKDIGGGAYNLQGGNAAFTEGKLGQALALQGAGFMTEIPYNKALNGFTLSLWFKADKEIPGPQVLFAKGTKDQTNHFEVYLDNNGAGSNHVRFYAPGAEGDTWIGAYELGVWNNITVVFDGTNVKITLNGAESNYGTRAVAALKEKNDGVSDKFSVGELVEGGITAEAAVDEVIFVDGVPGADTLTKLNSDPAAAKAALIPDTSDQPSNPSTSDGLNVLSLLFIPAIIAAALLMKKKTVR